MGIIHLYISCDTDAVIYVNGKNMGIITQFKPSIGIETDEKDIIISCTPIQNNPYSVYLPYSLHLTNYQNKLFCSDNGVFFVQYSQNTYLINLSPHCLELPNQSDTYIPLPNFSFSLHHNIACFSSERNNLFYPISHYLTDVKVDIIIDKIFLHAKTISGYYALILDNEFHILFENTADKIEFDGIKVITLTHLKTIAQHGRVNIFTLGNTCFTTSESYTVYLQSSPTPPACIEALPTAFLEAIYLKDTKLARSYLHPNLNAILDSRALVEFFGDFVSFTPDRDNLFQMTLIYESVPKYVKHFSFTVQNNLITNITTN